MAFLMDILEGLFFYTIYGAAAVGAAVYGIAAVLKCLSPKLAHPAIFAAVAAVLALLTLPSVPRYCFQAEVFDELRNKPWVRASGQAYWGELTEPLTLFATPLGSATLISPSLFAPSFQRKVRRFGEPDRLYWLDVDCADNTVWIAQPDAAGMLRYTSAKPEPMDNTDSATFCESDWTAEKLAMKLALKGGRRDLEPDRGLF